MGMDRSSAGGLHSLRDANRRLVIQALRRHGVISRAQIARITGLSRSTVSSLVTDLQAAGLIVEREGDAQQHGSQVGRPPVLIALSPSAGAAVGIDFGHSHIAVAVGDLAHTVLAERWQQIDVDHHAVEGLDTAAQMVDAALAEAGLDRDRVIGVGMGLPGPISTAEQTVGSTSILPGWVGVRAAREMERRLGMPVSVENDANLGALAEHVWGAGRGVQDVAYIKASSGIGAGLILGGRLHRGFGGTAGEIGHTQFREDGAICRCGNRGCLETVARADAIVNSVATGRGLPLTIAQVIDLAHAGDAPAQRVIADAGRAIGVGVANLCNLLNPQRVIVGGELAPAGDVLLAPLLDSLNRYAIPTAASEVDVRAGELGQRAEVMGALALVLSQPVDGIAREFAAAIGLAG
jgi:predicted NBD/HSP70 family sugar kinase/biotin operon repressor